MTERPVNLHKSSKETRDQACQLITVHYSIKTMFSKLEKTFELRMVSHKISGIPEFLDSGRKSWTLDSGRWTLDAGLWTLDSGRWTQDAGLWTLDSGRWTLGSERWTLDS